jgi:hypothetical protein
VTGNKPSVEFAQIIIDSNILLSTITYEKSDSILFNVLIQKKLAWALFIAISIKDTIRSRKVTEAIMAFEDRIARDDALATWGFSFDSLLSNKRAGLTKKEENKIIEDLEKRLKRISTTMLASSNIKKFCIEHAALRLARHYRRQNKTDETKRVILKYGDELRKLAEMSVPLIAFSHYEELRLIYQEYGLVSEATSLDATLQRLGKDVTASFKTIQTPCNIPQEEFENYISHLLDGEISAVLCKICLQFIPKKAQAEIGLRSIAEKCVITYKIRRQMYDHNGRLVASLDSIDNDIIGHLISHISQLMQLEIPFLHCAMSGFINKFEMTKDKIIELIFKSPIFDQHNKEFVEAGVQAYLNENHLVAAHLLIPQIEAAIRNLLNLAGGSVIKPNINGGFDYRTLGDLLKDDLLNKILDDCFGTDFIFYFKILFLEKLGWNIRNNICHGISKVESIQKHVTDRIMHVLLLLANVRFANDEGTIK